MFLLTELQDLGHATRPKSGTFISYKNALWTNGISWVSASSTVIGELPNRLLNYVVAGGGGWFERKT